MSRVEELKDLSQAQAQQTAEDYKSLGAKVETIKQKDGRFTVKATFSD